MLIYKCEEFQWHTYGHKFTIELPPGETSQENDCGSSFRGKLMLSLQPLRERNLPNQTEYIVPDTLYIILDYKSSRGYGFIQNIEI